MSWALAPSRSSSGPPSRSASIAAHRSRNSPISASSLSTNPTCPAPAPSAPVDVEANLTELAKGHDLNWRTSIVDLMKLLDLDSSLSARKELAHELGYSGDTADSASMNIWLHRQVMNKLAANGGKVPADLKD